MFVVTAATILVPSLCNPDARKPFITVFLFTHTNVGLIIIYAIVEASIKPRIPYIY